MPISLVTGVAGFIGSHLCRRLLDKGFSVIGIDSFIDFYPKWIKKRNLLPFFRHNKFEFIERNINNIDLPALIKKTDFVFHLAAQAGVRTSWGRDFSIYIKNNIEATQKLLEASKKSSIQRFIYASSSSVYGLSPELPMSENSPLYPYSPYGVTKLAAEHLCFLYFKNYGIPCISLRFFTVYGPGQRPDMAFHRFLKAVAEDKPISIYGDGEQTRDFTYVDDIIEAIYCSLTKGNLGEVYNVGGGNQIKLKKILPKLEKICQRKVKFRIEKQQKGDVPHTFADVKKIKKDLGFLPEVQLDEGLKEEWKWIKNLYSY